MNQQLSIIKSFIPANAPIARIEKGIEVILQDRQRLQKEPLHIKLAGSDNRHYRNLVGSENDNEWVIIPMCLDFAQALFRYCKNQNFKQSRSVEDLFQIAQTAVINNKWLTITDIILLVRSMDWGSLKIENGVDVFYPEHYGNFTAKFLNDCIHVYWAEKLKAQAELEKEKERKERANYPKSPTAPPPEIQENLDKLKKAWTEDIARKQDGAPAQKVSTTNVSDEKMRQWVFENVLCFEIHTIRAKRWALKRDGQTRIVEIIDEFLTAQENKELGI